jgi:BTB/POZ domain
MLQRSSTGKRKRSGDLDAEVTCHMILQPNEKDEFIQSIKQLYQSESLCDITFKVGEQLFPAHRIVLAAANRSRTLCLFSFGTSN